MPDHVNDPDLTHAPEPVDTEMMDREQRFGTATDPAAYDSRLSWALTTQDRDQGVALWGLSWSLELRLRALYVQQRVDDPTLPLSLDFQRWMMTTPDGHRSQHSSQDTVDGILSLDAWGLGASSTTEPGGWSPNGGDTASDGRAYVQACRDQAAQRLGDVILMPMVTLSATERPERRHQNTVFADEALIDVLQTQLLLHVERQVLEATLIAPEGTVPDERRRARL